MLQVSQPLLPEVASVFITEELALRSSKGPDYRGETVALRDLSRQMIDGPDKVLPLLVDIAMDMCGAVSGGISLHEPDPAPGVFRWHHLRGDLAKFTGATTPRHFSPCGITLDRRTPILVQRPERVYTWLQEAQVSLPECLLVPLYFGRDEPIGTLWIVSADEGHFDKAHSDTMKEVAAFAGIALKMSENEQQLRSALERQEMLAREMDHRVKNVFAVVDGIVRMSAREGGSAADLSHGICDRLRALSAAHGLVRRSAEAEAPPGGDFGELLRMVLEPHGGTRMALDGPSLHIGPQAASSLALVFHELATNAVKYGALASAGGTITATWRLDDSRLALTWSERGGPVTDGPPQTTGFGTLLSQRTIAGMGGAVAYEWQPEGLTVTLSVPTDRLTR